MERNPTIINLPASVYPHLSDEQLVQLTQAGLAPAYDQLVQRYRKAVCLIAARYVGTDGAQDVAQDVFLIAYHALGQLDDPAKFGGWLRAIARHRAERWGRREGRQQPAEPAVLETFLNRFPNAGTFETPEENCLQKERHKQIWQAIDNLSESHREVIILHHLEDWPLSRIADFLSVSEDVVRGRLYRARLALRNLLVHERK